MTYEQIKTTAKILAIVLPLLILFYLFVIKPNQHEKNKKKANRKKEMEPFDFLTSDNTGYHKSTNNKQVKNQ